MERQNKGRQKEATVLARAFEGKMESVRLTAEFMGDAIGRTTAYLRRIAEGNGAFIPSGGYSDKPNPDIQGYRDKPTLTR